MKRRDTCGHDPSPGARGQRHGGAALSVRQRALCALHYNDVYFAVMLLLRAGPAASMAEKGGFLGLAVSNLLDELRLAEGRTGCPRGTAV